MHRFKVTVPASKTVPYTVSEEKDFGSSVAITNSDDQNIRIVINQTVTSEAVKKALEQSMVLRGKMAATQRELQQQERQRHGNRSADSRGHLREGHELHPVGSCQHGDVACSPHSTVASV